MHAAAAALSVRVPAHQQQQRRIGRQHVVRQLGRQQLADDPVGQVPGEQEGEPRIGAEAASAPPARLAGRARRTATGTAKRSARSSPAESRAIPGRRRPCPACPCRAHSCQNAQPDFTEMATIHGRDQQATSAMPRSGFSSRSQLRSRSIDATSVAIGQQAEQRDDRPLDQDGRGLPRSRTATAPSPAMRGLLAHARGRDGPARLARARRWQAAWRRSWRCAPRRPARRCRPAQSPRSGRRGRRTGCGPRRRRRSTAMMAAEHRDQAVDPDRRFGALAADSASAAFCSQ